jgi:hypothetical protein
MTTDSWSFRDERMTDVDLVGFDVEATDGAIGRVDDVAAEDGAGWIVVDTGPWVFGRRIALPAGVIERVDVPGRRVHLACGKEDVRYAPDYDPREGLDEAARAQLADHFAGRAVGEAAP